MNDFNSTEPRLMSNLIRWPNLLFILLVLAACLLVIQMFPVVKTSDSLMYLNAASNISNFCYSDLPLVDGACIPRWGSQPPGYPFFLFVATSISENVQIVIFCQFILFFLSVLYFSYEAYPAHRSNLLFRIMLISGIVSPAAMARSYSILTEYLTSAALIFVLATCLKIIRERRLYAIQLTSSIVITVLMRWDMFVIAPLIFGFLFILGYARTHRIILAIMGFVIALPVILLMLRAIMVGLPVVPSSVNGPGFSIAEGPMHFFRNVALDQRAVSRFLWPLIWRNWSEFGVDIKDECKSPSNQARLFAFSERVDLKKICDLMQEARTIPNGQPMPPALDDAFKKMADELVTLRDIPSITGVRLLRIWQSWPARPLPYVEFNGQMILSKLSVYYYLILSFFFLAGLFRGGREYRMISIFFLMFAICRCVFLVLPPISALEDRYLDVFFPGFDLLALFALPQLAKKHTFATNKT